VILGGAVAVYVNFFSAHRAVIFAIAQLSFLQLLFAAYLKYSTIVVDVVDGS